jgi:SAM-dependent methyltransferase
MTGPNQEFWQERFEKQQIGWDRGAPNPQLLTWLEKNAIHPCRIAIPGCGGGWEVAELAARGFEVIGIDYTKAAVSKTNTLLEERGLKAEVVQADVLTYQPEKPFDAIYEQTCLCAIYPDHWIRYSEQLYQWLKPKGLLLALFMQMPRENAIKEGLIEGPPYHCDINGMRALFRESKWAWPKPPYAKIAHPNLSHELGLILQKN